jgi:hypothetical protein
MKIKKGKKRRRTQGKQPLDKVKVKKDMRI